MPYFSSLLFPWRPDPNLNRDVRNDCYSRRFFGSKTAPFYIFKDVNGSWYNSASFKAFSSKEAAMADRDDLALKQGLELIPEEETERYERLELLI